MRFLKSLYVQVLIGLAGGILVGHFIPESAKYLKPLADMFVNLIKMIVGPIVFCTVLVGIAKAGSAKTVGRLGAKSLLYFEVVTTIALVVGLTAAHVFRPGDGVGADPATYANAALPANLAKNANAIPHSGDLWLDFINFVVGLVPSNIVNSFAQGSIIHILLFSILLGLALASMGEKAQGLVKGIDTLGHGLLRIIGYIMRLAPLAAFGAMAYTIGEHGIDSLRQLGKLILCLYGACAVFILGVLWPICRFIGGISLWKLMKYIREEIFITLGTASSEAVLPRMLEKMEKLGARKEVVGFVIPAGYSFNLDGSTLYMPLATLFIAQALGIDLTWQQQAIMFGTLIFTSKGIAGVAGASMVVLLTALESTQVLPVAAITLVLGIDRIQNEVRSLTNIIGNAVATVVLARWEKSLDMTRAHHVLNGNVDVEATMDSSEERPLPEPEAPIAKPAT